MRLQRLEGKFKKPLIDSSLIVLAQTGSKLEKSEPHPAPVKRYFAHFGHGGN